MDSVKPKKMLILNILDILKRYTDEDHRLSQKDIVVEPLSSIVVKLQK